MAGRTVPGRALPQGGGQLGSAAVSFDGADQLVREYIESEFLARLSRRDREFLTRTAVLDRMSGPLCEAVLDRPGAAVTLDGLARSNLLLVPLDRHGRWYRYHHLFRDMLLAELERLEPGLLPVLRRRAASWCLDNELPEDALEYSIVARDTSTAARLVQRLWLPTYRQGRVTTIQQWLRRVEDPGTARAYPMLAVLAGMLAATTGWAAEAERWADTASRWQDGTANRPGDPAIEGWAAVLRAILSRDGAAQMRADADEAAQKFAAANVVAPVAWLCQGLAGIQTGDFGGAAEFFEDVVRAAPGTVAPDVLAAALSELALLAMAGSRWDQAESLAGQAAATLRQGRIEDSYVTPLVCAVQARAALHRGDGRAARQHLVGAQRSRPSLTYAIPHIAVQARTELGGLHVALGDLAGARTLLREIDELLRRRPGLGTLASEAGKLRSQLSSQPSTGVPGASALTAAELRLLPLLSTHLSFPAIAAELYLSKNTVRSQAYSIYRKLGVSSRNQAVNRARDLTLLER